MPASKSMIAPYIAPETLRRLERDAAIHDQFCRCRTCKPPLVGERSAEWTHRVEAGLVIAIVIVAVALVAAVL